MAMSELQKKLLFRELAKIGLHEAGYLPETDQIQVPYGESERPILITADNFLLFQEENRDYVYDTLVPLVDRVKELVAAWNQSRDMPVKDLPEFRVLAEYNSIILAARDDTEHGHGLHFVTWEYTYDRTGMYQGHYTEDYAYAKEDFAVRCGLVPADKITPHEQAAEIIAAIEYRIANDGGLTLAAEKVLKGATERLRDAYPVIPPEPPMEKETHDKPTLSEILNGSVSKGDWVIATAKSDYGYLLGIVTAIDALGTPEHGTANETDDIHVDFTAFEYPPDRIAEIEQHFSVLYGEPKTFDELPLDDVIMAPQMLIGLSYMGQDEMARMGNLRQNCEAYCNCFAAAVVHESDREAALVERIDKNLADYHMLLKGFFSNDEIIEMAGKISAMTEMHSYLSFHGFSETELDYLLQFENPLEVVADAWNERQEDHDRISDFLYDLCDKQNALKDYPLITDAIPAQTARPAESQETPEPRKQAAPEKPKTLAERLKAAGERVKAQDPQSNDMKTNKREERE